MFYRVVKTNHGKYGKLWASDLFQTVPYSIFPDKPAASNAIANASRGEIKEQKEKHPGLEFKVKHKHHNATVYRRNPAINSVQILTDYDIFVVRSDNDQFSTTSTFWYRGHTITPNGTGSFLIETFEKDAAALASAKTLLEAFHVVDRKYNREGKKPDGKPKYTRKKKQRKE